MREPDQDVRLYDAEDAEASSWGESIAAAKAVSAAYRREHYSPGRRIIRSAARGLKAALPFVLAALAGALFVLTAPQWWPR